MYIKLSIILAFIVNTCFAQVYIKSGGKFINWNNKILKQSVDGDLQYTTNSSNTTVSFTISGTSTDTLKVDWGDNGMTNVIFTGSTQTISHTYSLAGQYNVFFTKKVSSIKYFSSTSAYYSGKYSYRQKLWTGLKYFNQSGSTIAKGGYINNIPADTSFTLDDRGTASSKYSCNFNTLSKNLKKVAIYATVPIYSGDIDSLSKSLNYLSIYSPATTTYRNYGNVYVQNLSTALTVLSFSNLPDTVIWNGYWNNKVLTALSITNGTMIKYNFIIDSISHKIVSLNIGGSGIIGNFNTWFYKTRGLTSFTISSLSASGQVDTSYYRLTSVICNSNSNFINNNIVKLKNCTYIQFVSNGITYGATDSLTKAAYQNISGTVANYSGCTGEITAIPSSSTTIIWSGFGSITYNGGTVPSFSSLGIFTLSGNMTEAQLRAFIIAWSATATNKSCTCNFAGTNAGLHINATDDPTLYNAYYNLQALGKTININTY